MLGRGNLEALHALREGATAPCFDHQMHMRALDADVHDPEVGATKRRDHCLAKSVVGIEPAKALNLFEGADRDLHGLARLERRTTRVRRTRPLGKARASRACALSTAALAVLVDLWQVELNVTLARSSHSHFLATADPYVN